MILNAVTGWSASSRRESVTLDGLLRNVKDMMGDVWPVTIWNSFYSSRRSCIQDSVNAIVGGMDSAGGRVLLVGKSMGGVRTWWMMQRHWKRILGGVGRNNGRLSVVLIDPHGWQVGDRRVGSYGVRFDEMGYLNQWNRPDVRFLTVYQRNKYPKGARLNIPDGIGNVRNVLLGQGADHFNIEDFDSPFGREVASMIAEEIGWVAGSD